MPWFKVDDGMHSHPKTVIAGTPAIGLWVRCGSWSSDQLTDGFVPAGIALMYGTRPMIRQLLASGLWTEVEGGYQFHDWGDRNPMRETVEIIREEKRKAGQAGGRASAKVRANGKHQPSGSEAECLDPAGVPVVKQINPRSRPGPVPVVGGSLRDGPELGDAGEDPDHHEDQPEPQALEYLALTVHRLQPTWRLARIRDVIAEGRERNGGLRRLTPALLIVAVAKDSTSPRRVLSDGYWWQESDSRYLEALEDPRLAEVLEPAS